MLSPVATTEGVLSYRGQPLASEGTSPADPTKLDGISLHSREEAKHMAGVGQTTIAVSLAGSEQQTDVAIEDNEIGSHAHPALEPLETLPNLVSAKSNPKLLRMVQHIETLLERTKGARHEMEQMIQITKELRGQCDLQKRECDVLETDQTKVKDEIDGLSSRLQTLMSDKMRAKQKLEELRLENIKLDAFLQQERDFPTED
ncbi:hypothetical protein BASA60_008284 [Batrachochytrium salamandrivorans]|nr:hypothetical protein BASA60_008284 [Batrachochytrium salamandrivorans]KAH6576391.1 hypothetical protein BASA62_001440 [Batrachochytrium salamandrivorans]KAH9276836.1 hypothetical protein BASA83_000347 [Batrachochytrium salamandrivorans]